MKHSIEQFLKGKVFDEGTCIIEKGTNYSKVIKYTMHI